ncbi:dihydroxyacetone kinase family protein [Agromyces silvae]|uniref:dihydroxyacetone kinase family protein n=1 Tax=Agromyces silvae TaxID=3388266 RepID=UPI00280AC931|nr:dihydroxyacetone kinase family protein [Agromyces protaetiae]
MTRLHNEPADFAEEAIDGFVAASGRWVRRVPGGVLRAAPGTSGSVAVVIGGGSGHYPAFGGLVGHGLAHGAALGNLFASPSAQQVRQVAEAADQGGGILLTFGNYAGDVANFGRAADALVAAGTDVRIVAVTDDISSAPLEQRHTRRGIAGDLAVFKVAGAAAERGYSLDDVERVARTANERTRSFGVAFSGCSLPGAHDPLFNVPEGRMAVGMGIHGEPGIGERDVPSANDLATLLVRDLLEETPDEARAGRGRIAVIVNGLGSVKYDELFVLYAAVERLLTAAGLEIVEPEVGELVTSFDMAGVSLTLCWLDDELEMLWRDPADAPAYSKGSVVQAEASASSAHDSGGDVPSATQPAALRPGSPASRAAASRIADGAQAVAHMLADRADELGRLDAIAGDGDHGIGMVRGSGAASAAARAAADEGAGSRTVVERASDAWSDRAGGTSGALWGAMLTSIGLALSDETEPTTQEVADGVVAAAEAVLGFGASLGDKSMVDAVIPFRDALVSRLDAGATLVEAWDAAAAAASDAAQATADLLPRIGRARPHGEKSLGTPDAGAVSFAAVAEVVGARLRAETTPKDGPVR